MGTTLAIVGVVFVFTALIFFIIGLINRARVQKALTWPTASGRVASTEVKIHKSSTRRSGGGYTNTTTYEPVVYYTYSVGGQSYTGRRLSYGGFQAGEQSARDKIASYPDGSLVQVHYNPGKPQDAVLELDAGSGKIYWIMGGIFLVLGAAGFLIGLIG